MNQLTNKQININNNIEINTLRKILKPEIRKAKGQNLVNTYIRLIGKQYESIIETSLNGTESIKTYKNNRSIKRVIENDNNKNKNKQNSQSISKKDVSNNTKSFSIYNNKISTTKSSLNISPIKKIKLKENINNNINNINNESQKNNEPYNFWKDYEFLISTPIEKVENKNIKNKKKKNSEIKKSKSVENISKENSNKKKELEKYYLYLLNRRKKISESEETNEDRQKEKIEVEILRQIFEKLYEEDEKLKKKLEDKNIPEFYKRFIIQDEIKKDNIFINKFKYNYKESQNLKGPALCNRSRLICENSSNYEPIYKRWDKVILNKEMNIEKIKEKLYKNKNRQNITKKKKIPNTKKWLKSMDNWYQKKIRKIKENKIKLERDDPDKKEYSFKPYINNNAKIKEEDEGLLCSDRLYLEYFTLKNKKEKKIQEEYSLYSFQPNQTFGINKTNHRINNIFY